MNNGIPIFPAGVLKIYQNPNPPIIPDIDDFDYTKQGGGNPESTQFGSENPNIVDKSGLADLKVWFEECIKDYFDNVMTLAYEEFWIHESWINKSRPNSAQSMHNHSNSLISGVYYIDSVPEHPPLIFEKVAYNADPFISLRKHYNQANANFSNRLAMPCTKGSLIMFNSYLFHGFGQNKSTKPRVSLAFNVLANLSDRDTYKLDFVKKERWVDNHNTDYVVKSDGTEGQNSINVKLGGNTEDGTIRRRMSRYINE